MEKVIHSKVRNRFDIEVTDAKTGELKQKVTSYNIVLNAFFNRLVNCDHKLDYIHLGGGSGTPAITDTSMFDFIGSKSATVDAIEKAYPTSYIRKKIVLAPSDYVGETITEVGFGYSSSSSTAVTHSMLKDSEGEPIAILKTDTDVLTIYATFYVTIGEGVAGTYVLPTADSNAIIRAVLEDKYYNYSGNEYYAYLGVSNEIQIANELITTAINMNSYNRKEIETISKDLVNRRWNIPTIRWDTDEANSHMISAIGCPTIATWLLPNEDIFPSTILTDIAIGVGDGETTEFNSPIPLFVENSDAIRVNGATQVRGSDYTIAHDNNNAEYLELYPSTKATISGGCQGEADRYPFFLWKYVESKACQLKNNSPIILDFEEPRPINRVIIIGNSFSYSNMYCTTTIGIDYSTDGEVWTNFYTSENTSASNISANETLETVTARYWRLTSTSTVILGARIVPNILLGYNSPAITFTTPPPDGASIEMDCSLDRPIKNENWVLDFGFSVQFERG